MKRWLAEFRSFMDLFFLHRLTGGQRLHILRYLWRTRILGQEIIRSVEVIHTLRCNCRCAFCSNEKLSEQRPVMKNGDVCKVLDKVAEYGVVAVIFLGGESMTDPSLLDYIRYARGKNLIPLLQTNGTLLTPENIRLLAEAGLFSVTITLQDTNPDRHDLVVQWPGAFRTISTALPMLKKYGIKVSLKALYSRETTQSGAFDRILAMAKREGVLLNVNPIMPVGRGLGEGNMLSDLEKQDYLRRLREEPCMTSHTKGEYDAQCPAGHLYLGILPDGEILPCYFLPLSVGNIWETSIQTAQRRAAEMGIFKKGLDSCVVAMNNAFYQEVIARLYCGVYNLPVRVYENEEIREILRRFSERT